MGMVIPLLGSTGRVDLGEAGHFAVLGAGVSDQVSAGGQTEIFGDVAFGPGGQLTLSGSSVIYGDVYKDADGFVTLSGGSQIAGAVIERDINPIIDAAIQASSNAAALPPDLTLARLDKKTTFLVATQSLFVVNVLANAIIDDDLYLRGTGTSQDRFIINISGTFELRRGANIVLEDLDISQVLFNVHGGQAAKLDAGANLQGTLLAPLSEVTVSGGVHLGAVIGGRKLLKLQSTPTIHHFPFASSPNSTPPVAVGDAYATDQDVPLVIAAPGVLTNDVHPDGLPITALKATDPTNGVLLLNLDGSFTYTPNTNYFGPDAFMYRATDGTNDSLPALVSITVNPIIGDDSPIANPDSYSTDEDVPLVIVAPGVLGNDTHPDLLPITAQLVSVPTNGVLNLNLDGSFTYTPNTNYFGPDAFMYRATDGTNDSLPALVSITVVSVPDRPIAVDDDFDGPLEGIVVASPGVLVNDYDGDGDVLTAVLTTQPARGTLTFSTNGSFSYVPGPGFAGTDSFTYQASDGRSLSEPATVRLRANLPPTVEITFPTNGTFLITEASFPFDATAVAADPDGTVTLVEFFAGTNQFGMTTNAPYAASLESLPVGQYVLSARATDNNGAQAVSAPINISVIEGPFITPGTQVLNLVLGIYEQEILITNPTPFPIPAARVILSNLLAVGTIVVDASGIENGQFFLQYNLPIDPGETVQVHGEYITPDRRPIAATYLGRVSDPLPPRDLLEGELIGVNKILILPSGDVRLEFQTEPNRFYVVEYSTDTIHWQGAFPRVKANANQFVFIDRGAPRTETPPSTVPQRFYRVKLLP